MKYSPLKKIFISLITGSLIFLTIYIVNDGHKLGTENKVIEDIYSAVVSVILGALVTMTLLSAQTMNEDSHTKNSEIFKEKLRAYRDFLETLGEYIKDGKLNKEEIKLLILKHAIININLNKANQEHFNSAISKINDDLFFENENNVPDYRALGELFNEIASIFKADLYGENISELKLMSYENFYEISNAVRTSTFYKESLDDFIQEIVPGREIFFSIKTKENEFKNYKFNIRPDASSHYKLAFDYALSSIKELNVKVEYRFEVAYKKLYKSLAINNPKILFQYKEKTILRIGITNRNRVALQFMKDDESAGMYALDALDGVEITNLNIQNYVPKIDLDKHISSCVKRIDEAT